MTTNINFSKGSLAISAILVSSLSIGAALAADDRKPRDAADAARSTPTTALDITASAARQRSVAPTAPSSVMRILLGPDGRPETVKRPAPPPAPKASTEGGRISRAEVIRRAKYWFDNRGKISYSWTARHRDPDSARHVYRQDCSGLVSMALHLKDSSNTESLPGVGIKIARTAMQPGDFTGRLGKGTGGSAGHVRLFEKWANKRAGTYWAYDFGSYPVKHQIYKLSTDTPHNRIGWTAYRYRKII